MTTADDPQGGGGTEDDDGDDGTAPSSSSTSPTTLPTICFVTPLKKLRLSPAFATQKGDGGKDDRRPVKVIGNDAHEEEPAAKEASCSMVNYSPFASPACSSLITGSITHFLLTVSRFDTLTAAQQKVVGEGEEDLRFVKITADTRAESSHKEGVTSAMVSSMLCCITLPHNRAD